MKDETRYAVFYRDRGYCQYCGLDMATSYAVHGTFQPDHLTPRCIGGKDDVDNLKLACVACNVLLGSLDKHIKKASADEWKALSSEQRHLQRKDHVLRKLADSKWHWMPDVLTMTLASRAISVNYPEVSVMKVGKTAYNVRGWKGTDVEFEKMKKDIETKFRVSISLNATPSG